MAAGLLRRTDVANGRTEPAVLGSDLVEGCLVIVLEKGGASSLNLDEHFKRRSRWCDRMLRSGPSIPVAV